MSIAVIAGLRLVSPRIPSQLIVVTGSILVFSLVIGPDHAGVALVDPVPLGFAAPTLPSFEHVVGLLGGALGISVMVFLESAAVARSLRAADEEPIDANRELVAAGVQNVVGGFVTAESIIYTADVAETMTEVAELAREAGFPDRVVLALPNQALVSVTVLQSLEELDHRLADAGSELVVALPDEAAEIARRMSWFRGLEAAGRTR